MKKNPAMNCTQYWLLRTEQKVPRNNTTYELVAKVSVNVKDSKDGP